MLNFTRPNLSTLIQQAFGDFQAQLPGADTTLRRSNVTVSSKVLAALANGIYGYIDWIWQQIFAFAPLWAFVFNIPQKQATFASGNGVFTGNNGTNIPIGTLWQDSLGNQYETTALGTIVGGTATVPILALTSGSAGDLAANAPLTIVSSLANINPNGAVDGNGLSGGYNQETPAAWSARVGAYLQLPPQGGTPNDYQNWAIDGYTDANGVLHAYAGVTRAWCHPLASGPGTVSLSFMMDGRPNPIPQAGDVAAVQAIINLAAPGTDVATVFAPTASPVNFTIHGVPVAQRAAVTAALQALFSSVVGEGQGVSLQGQIIPTVQGAALASGVTVVAPNADLPPIAGTIYTFGAPTYT